MAKSWTEEDEEFIRQNYLTRTYADLAEEFEVSPKAMESKIRRMGLKKQDIEDAEAPGGPPTRPAKDVEGEDVAPAGLQPIAAAGPLTRRRVEFEEETEEEREERMEAVREAAEVEKERRESERQADDSAKALKRLEAGLKKLHDGSYAKAVEEFERIVQEPPTDVRLVDRAKQYIDVCNERRRTQTFKPGNADEFYLQGVMLLNRGEFADALERFDKALDKAPGDDRVLYCQACAHARRGDAKAALKALDKAIQINDANRIFARNDSDFDPLRVHDGFRGLVATPEQE